MILRNFLNFQMDLLFYYIAHEIWDLPSLRRVKWKGQSLSRVPLLATPMDYTVLGIFQARILESEAFPFSRGSSQPKDRTHASNIAGGFFTVWATRETQEHWSG